MDGSLQRYERDQDFVVCFKFGKSWNYVSRCCNNFSSLCLGQSKTLVTGRIVPHNYRARVRKSLNMVSNKVQILIECSVDVWTIKDFCASPIVVKFLYAIKGQWLVVDMELVSEQLHAGGKQRQISHSKCADVTNSFTSTRPISPVLEASDEEISICAGLRFAYDRRQNAQSRGQFDRALYFYSKDLRADLTVKERTIEVTINGRLKDFNVGLL